LTDREPKISQIKVEGNRIGLRDLDEALQSVASRGLSDDGKLERTLIEEVRNRKNYIASAAEAKYGRALLREYREFLGQSAEEDETDSLTIRILGMGCPNCRRLTDEVMAVLTELGIGADVEHVTDVNQIVEYGAVGTPALVINKKIVSVGRVPRRTQIKKYIERENSGA
jgi:small redox-active disulfide protein 2